MVRSAVAVVSKSFSTAFQLCLVLVEPQQVRRVGARLLPVLRFEFRLAVSSAHEVFRQRDPLLRC